VDLQELIGEPHEDRTVLVHARHDVERFVRVRDAPDKDVALVVRDVQIDGHDFLPTSEFAVRFGRGGDASASAIAAITALAGRARGG
jgi:hypothetical protein